MRIKCEYCESFIDDTDEKCPYCGAVNKGLARSGKGIPKTIEELCDFAKSHNLPLEEMHYYLGENYEGPKAIGIYHDEDSDNFIVYKNKSDGTRSVRYQGKDEAYAVNEIYQKMKTDVMNQKARNVSKSEPTYSSSSTPSTGGGLKKVITYVAIFFLACVLLGQSCGGCADVSSGSSDSYSDYGSGYTYDYSDDSNSSGSWWSSDDDDDDNDSWWSSDDDWDSSDWDWGSSDSWDSGYSDWDSDW